MKSHKQELRVIQEQGQLAAASGQSLDACPYRLPEKRNAWVRGYHEYSPPAQLSEEEKVRGKERMAEIKKMFGEKA